MAKIDEQTIRKVAEIARLNLTNTEVKKFSKDLGEILSAFKKIDRANTVNVKPSFQPMPIKNVTREDRVEPGLSREEALSNVKKNKEGNFFKGPKVIG